MLDRRFFIRYNGERCGGIMEDLHFLRLWDCYHPLLTPKQQEIANLYFNCDCSLSEIAEQMGCSRQSVSDCLATCRKQFEEYESKLHFLAAVAEMSLHSSFLLTDIGRWAEGAELTPQQKQELDNILSRDYEEEVKQALKEHADELL